MKQRTRSIYQILARHSKMRTYDYLTTPTAAAAPVEEGCHISGPQCLLLSAYPAMEPTAQPNGHVWEMCGHSTGSPTAKPKLGASYLKFVFGHGYPQDIRHRRQCCGRPVVRAEESVEGVSLLGVCIPRVTHPIGVGSPRLEPCFGGALWSAAKPASRLVKVGLLGLNITAPREVFRNPLKMIGTESSLF